VPELLRRRGAGRRGLIAEVLPQQVAHQQGLLLLEVVLRPLHRLHGQLLRRRRPGKLLVLGSSKGVGMVCGVDRFSAISITKAPEEFRVETCCGSRMLSYCLSCWWVFLQKHCQC
jgi:hypothetical protein